jgi:hypothetical protein
MAKMNFSAEEFKIFDLANDLARGDFTLHVDKEKVTRKDLEDYLRNTINNDILKGATLYQAYRRNNIVLFEIIEEIVNVTIGTDVLDCPFIENFVEFKNRALGDRTAWYSEGKNFLTVASFAGNHWDTNREALDNGEEFTLSKEWIYIHVYDELERFLLNITTLERLTDVIYKSFNKYIKDRIYVQFQSVASSVPAEFSMSGNTEKAVGQLCDLVQAAGGYSSLTIAGTKAALRRLSSLIIDKYFADSQREAKAHTGNIGEWEGNKLMVIPQTLKPSTFELALDDNMLFIMGADVKPIKLEFIGDTRTQEVRDGRINNDMTMELQVQTCLGMGMMMPSVFGVFRFAN